MRIELIPLILAGIIGLLGLALMIDAMTADDVQANRERRRRPRLERSRGGEAAIGLGVLCMAAAFGGRDSWKYSIVAAMVGAAFMLLGVAMNFRFLGGMISNRGVLRRRD